MTGRKIRRLLIANRGEIAVRIQRACRELGIETIQVFSEADRDSLAVRIADHAVCIGPARSVASYLNVSNILSAALAKKADAIHPGYGFLSENAAFARACEQEGIAFVGPPADVISLMGDKATARRTAQRTGFPITPGSSSSVADMDDGLRIADELGYPIMLKASAGGGGRGMRVIASREEFGEAYNAASQEAIAAFGDGSLYIEKYLSHIRHVEVQILSDGDRVLHLGERDCSLQRRNQKVFEESPSPAIDNQLRKEICDAAVRLCQNVGYQSAGTIECILDEHNKTFYFMEMNTRIQVEHPVTEMVTGTDIVKEQIRIAQGEPIGFSQSDIDLRGHAIECRINAEDWQASFMPSPGRITNIHFPGGPGIRIDSHVFSGYEVPPYYDSLVAKLIAWGHDRNEAIARMERALAEMVIDGIKVTIPFHRELLKLESVRNGQVHTKLIEELAMKDPHFFRQAEV